MKAEAARLGFALSGIAPAVAADTFHLYERWLDAGHAGSMQYLHDKREQRRHPNSILKDVRSVLMLGIEYSSKPHPNPMPAHYGKVARYAQGPDYHDILWAKLNQLSAWLSTEIPDSVSRGVVDTAPLLERDFARRAGLGWIGKNTLLINPKRGSYFFLAALLTNLELKTDEPFTANHCGTCTACLDVCPTDAFPMAGTLDATKCISYQTIEHHGPLPAEANLHGWLFGCDICQEVCPWNRFAGDAALPHDDGLMAIDCEELTAMSDEKMRQRFKGTALWRAKPEGLRRNAGGLTDDVRRGDRSGGRPDLPCE